MKEYNVKRCLLLIIIMFMCGSLHAEVNAPIIMKDIEIAATPSFTRITFTLTKKARGRVRSFKGPGRIEIEFANTYLPNAFPEKIFSHANIKEINTLMPAYCKPNKKICG